MSNRREVIFHIPNLKGGGAERVAVEIAKHFVSKGHTPVFFVHNDHAAYELPREIEVIVARKPGHIGRTLELFAILRRRSPVAVLSFLPYANIISILAGILNRNRVRVVVSEHLAVSPSVTIGWKEKLKLALVRSLYQASHSIIAVSTGVSHDLRSLLKGRAPERIVVIYNPCYVPESAGTTRSERNVRPKVLAAGRLTDQKGFDTLIRAFAVVRRNVTDATLVISGEGPQREVLESLVRELHLSDSVSLPGFARDINTHYESANLFVCSSRLEGFGNVIVEALSFGLPVVSTRCPHGPEEILQDGRFGRLVAVDDESGLAQAIIESLSSPVDEQALIARAKDFSLETIGDRYLEQVGLLSRFDGIDQTHEAVA
ncbi:glycosyltransferase [Caballeronia novacaledonica]|uniref:glycosyltransferase n=1 Tax=Caballeronia novacaledonica TaxID=1544861 RepID=UPI001EE2A5A3|nr:glycosyltransferase [Caballeronia novacaledonica]GJH13803.1 glycosyltransferase [Caballeronia novacaledonica]